MEIKAKKSLGQNFLIDRNILEQIVDTVDIFGKEVLEIGPGSGNLTAHILKKKPKKIFVIEKDDDLSLLLEENLNKYDVIVGMYHDQVLAPVKTLFGFNAINIIAGLPFIRISPDHGPNIKMLGKNLSNPRSIIEALKFLDK